MCDQGTAAECCERLEKEDGVDRVVEMRDWKVCRWNAIYITPVINSRVGSLGIDCDLRMSGLSNKVTRWSTSGSLRKE